MCKRGDEVLLTVPVPATLSHNWQLRWATKAVDRCIAPIVEALNDAGIYTAGCCCGHGNMIGSIILHDGRILLVLQGDGGDAWQPAGESPASIVIYLQTLAREALNEKPA